VCLFRIFDSFVVRLEKVRKRYVVKLGHHAGGDEYIGDIVVEIESDNEVLLGDYFRVESIEEKE